MSKKIRYRAWTKVRRTQEVKDQGTPWLDWYVGVISGDVLVWLGKRALGRGDIHEFNHCVAALKVGNSSGNHENCALNKAFPDALKGFDVATMQIGQQ